MKINLSSLMCLIDEKERKYSSMFFSLKKHVFNTSIQELSGVLNIIEDNKKDFEEELLEVQNLSNEIIKLKSILYEKNFELLLNYRNSKQRVTEVNNSYFQIQEINYNQDEIKSQIQILDEKIRNTDFEISKLNSIEFEIDL